MTDYDNNNRGVLFKNDRKSQDSQPDYKGSINVNGQELWLSAWIKSGQKGKFMSLSVTPKEAQQAAPAPTQRRSAPPPPRQPGYQDDGSDVPF
jgi:hypothetical protein